MTTLTGASPTFRRHCAFCHGVVNHTDRSLNHSAVVKALLPLAVVLKLYGVVALSVTVNVHTSSGTKTALGRLVFDRSRLDVHFRVVVLSVVIL